MRLSRSGRGEKTARLSLQPSENCRVLLGTASLARGVDDTPPHDARLVDDKGASRSEALLREEHAISLSDLTVRPEVTEQRVGQPLLRGVDLEGVRGIARDAEHHCIIGLERGLGVAQFAELTCTNAREGEGIEHQDDVLLPAEVSERYRFAVLIGQGEVRSLLAYFGRHRGISAWRAGQRAWCPANWHRH